MRRILVMALAAAFVVSTVGADSCGTSDPTASGGEHSSSKAERRAAKRLKAKRAARRVRARHEAEARARARERRRARARAEARARERARQKAAAAPPPAQSNCDPNYSGCLDPNASDYDCEGGSGDGPEYTGTVTVLGDDHYDLNRDDDSVACDP